MRGAGLLILLASLAPAPAARADGALHAERITAENASRLQVGGIHAVGGIGDWALGNGTLCAVIADASHETVIAAHGGTPLDLGRCGRRDDQLAYWELLRGLAPPKLGEVVRRRTLELPGGPDQGAAGVKPDDVPIDVVGAVPTLRAERDARSARIVATSVQNGVRYEVRYQLGLEEPSQLRVTTRLERVGPGPRVPITGLTLLHGNASLRVFVPPGRRSSGFSHRAVDPNDALSLARAMQPADRFVLVGDDAVEPGIAYAFQLREAWLEGPAGGRRALPLALVTSEHFTLLMTLHRPLWLGSPDRMGLLELAQMPWMDLRAGERIRTELVVAVGSRADVASAADALHAAEGAPLVRGVVADPALRLHVRDASGRPLSQVRPGGDGSFSFRVPVGSRVLELRGPGGRSREVPFELGAEGLDLGRLELPGPARLRLPRGSTLRLVFQGLGGTPDPVLGDDQLGLRFGGEPQPSAASANHLSLAGLPTDPTQIVLAPGAYRVLATRGPEFSVSEARIDLAPGETRTLRLEAPRRLLETPDHISADLHVHGAHSFDAALPWPRQLAAFAAQGGEVLVASDHHVVTDPRPPLQELDLAGRIAGIPGVEVTGTAETAAVPYTIGHSNAFPMRPDPAAPRAGGPATAGRRLREVMAELRQREPRVLLQLNHPRGAPGERAPSPFHYLDHMAVVGRPFRASRLLDSGDNRALVEPGPDGVRDLDFDAMELWNGASADRYRWNRAAWFSLLLQGEVRTATANSDSHRAGEIVALPRTYLRVPDDRVAPFDEDAFLEALREGRAFGTSGPLLDVALVADGRRARPGSAAADRFAGRTGTLEVAVRAAPWVPVSRARVFVDAELAWHGATRAGETLRIPLAFERDAFVVVEVEGDADARFAALAPGFRPFAFTNPIFVDADGDGRWRAPGFSPSSPPDALANPSRSDRPRR